MTEMLLQTKLHIPASRAVTVARPVLQDRIEQVALPCFTLVSAPAGFGKTTLLSSWASTTTRSVAWVSLDEGDDDPVRFLSYLSAALQVVDPQVGEDARAALETPQPAAPDPLLTLILNDIAAYDGTLAVVLDDYHLIASDVVHRAVNQLIDRLPANAQLILSTRIDPPFSLARLRASGRMVELRTRDLRFSAEHTAAFLRDVMGLHLSSAQLERLDLRTEGWIAGLQMAALSMRGKQDIASFLEGFEGSNRYILDYLLEEVLEQQPAALREFLLKTSILRSMNGALCDHVTGHSGGEQTLRTLEEANLFLIPLDDARRWYRYHHLFADLLQLRLRAERPAELAPLHHAASVWYQEQGELTEAVRHALHGEDYDRAAGMLAANALEMTYHGAVSTLRSLVLELPHGLVQQHPRLSVALAWSAIFEGDLEQTERQLGAARQAIETLERQQAGAARELEGQILPIEAYLAWLMRDVPGATRLSQQALDLLPEGDSLIRAWTLMVYGSMLRTEGEPGLAEPQLEASMRMCQRLDSIPMTLDSIWELTVLYNIQGKLRAIEKLCQQTLETVRGRGGMPGRRFPAVSYIHGRLALVYAEWNELTRALDHARQGVEAAQRWGMMDAIVQCNTILSKVLRQHGQFNAALDALSEASQAAHGISEWYVKMIEAQQALVLLDAGQAAAAFRWIDTCGLSAQDEVLFHREVEYRALAKLLVARAAQQREAPGKDVLALIDRLQVCCEKAGARFQLIDVLLSKAVALKLSGRPDKSLTALESSLELAGPECFIGTYLIQNPPVIAMLNELKSCGHPSPQLAAILAAFEERLPATPSAVSQAALIEPLSERELDVLRYLNSSLTSSEIADELYVAVSTVRSHIKSIYQKLGVHRRIEAVERARELGLL